MSDLLGEVPPNESPYFGLREYFRLCEKPAVSLTFTQIEEMIGEPLGWEAKLYEEFWYDGYEPEEAGMDWRLNCYICSDIEPDAPKQRIAESWISQGYRFAAPSSGTKACVFSPGGSGYAGT